MIKATWLEIKKIAARPRSYISFAAITVFSFVIQLAMFADGKSYISFITQNAEQSFTMGGNILNGYLVCFIILQALIIQIPLLVALVTGDLISGEAATGTIRLLVSQPISRTKILLSKFFAGSFYTMGILVWLGILALGLDMFVFGTGDLIVLKSDMLVILPGDDTLWRFLTALALAFLALTLVSSLSLMFSCFSENSIAPIIITMVLIILFTIIGTLEVPIFDKIKPFLFTTHRIVWRDLFDDPVPKEKILTSCIVLAVHIAAFLGISIYHFNRKDILS